MHWNSLGKLEDVKDKLFHLDPVRFVWCDELTLCVHIRDLLLGHMVLQLWLVFPVTNIETTRDSSLLNIFVMIRGHKLIFSMKTVKVCQCALALLYNVSEEGEAKEVVGHISCVEHEPAIGAALLSRCQGDLAVLHHLIATIHLTDHTHRLCRVGFLHHLQNKSTLFLPIDNKTMNTNE